MGDDKKSGWRGAFDKVKSQVEQQVESHKEAKADAEDKYGRQVASHKFGSKWVHIYSGGFVQIRELVALKSSAPYERLVSIESQAEVQKKSGFGRGAAAVVTLGVNQLSSNMRGHVYLIIATDANLHSITATPTEESVKAAKALEVAGKSVLANSQSTPAQSSPTPPPVAAPDPAEQLKKLAELHAAGVVTDEEFAAKKADLLDRM